MIGTRVAFRGAFGPHEGIVLEETEDSVILKVEKNDTLPAVRWRSLVSLSTYELRWTNAPPGRDTARQRHRQAEKCPSFLTATAVLSPQL
jgi:hypothetical protein